MKIGWLDKYVISLVVISVVVAFLTHFPELISLFDPSEQNNLFPGMKGADVANEWFRESVQPDLVFMDIHLADGSAFEIFNHVEIRCPVIFTTAYDEYALKAFKVNSVDYLLKPIGIDDIRHALEKLKRLQESYKTHFLIPVKGDKLIPVSVDMILFFHIDNGMVKGVLDDGTSFVFTQTLDELSDCVNPSLFFRVNRQYLVARKAVRDIDLWFNGRLSLNLKIPVPEKILVSKARAGEFKEWFAGNG